ncbi:hypothetical protein QQP08_012043 [Theobroma cacao]|nr:hypothetical protein QQP08_012043 [Theobroma cacao]
MEGGRSQVVSGQSCMAKPPLASPLEGTGRVDFPPPTPVMDHACHVAFTPCAIHIAYAATSVAGPFHPVGSLLSERPCPWSLWSNFRLIASTEHLGSLHGARNMVLNNPQRCGHIL